MSINENIRKRRRELGLTLEDVAKLTKVRRQTIQRYESGTIKNIPSDMIEQLAIVLCTTPAKLMGWARSSEANDALVERIHQDSRRNALIHDILDMTDEDINFLSVVIDGLKHKKK